MNIQGFPSPIIFLFPGVNPIETSFVPTLTFLTLGDLSVVYTVQDGWAWKLGNLVAFGLRVAGTPTFTTAAGELRIEGLPYAAVEGRPIPLDILSTFAWPAGITQFSAIPAAGASFLVTRGIGSGATRAGLTTAECPSGSARDFITGGVYRAA